MCDDPAVAKLAPAYRTAGDSRSGTFRLRSVAIGIASAGLTLAALQVVGVATATVTRACDPARPGLCVERRELGPTAIFGDPDTLRSGRRTGWNFVYGPTPFQLTPGKLEIEWAEHFFTIHTPGDQAVTYQIDPY